MNKSIFVAGAAATGLGLAGIALGLCLTLSSGSVSAETPKPENRTVYRLVNQADYSGKQAGQAFACGAGRDGRAIQYADYFPAWKAFSEEKIGPAFRRGWIESDDLPSISQAFGEAAKASGAKPCAPSVASAAG